MIEAGAGLAMLALPALAVSILIGAPFNTPADSIVGRVGGAALLSLGIACWRARRSEDTLSTNGIVSAMLLYNVITAAVLAYAGTGGGLFGVGLWPVVVLHGLMAVWCLVRLLAQRS